MITFFHQKISVKIFGIFLEHERFYLELNVFHSYLTIHRFLKFGKNFKKGFKIDVFRKHQKKLKTYIDIILFEMFS